MPDTVWWQLQGDRKINKFLLSFYLSKMLIKQVMNFSQQQNWRLNPPLGEVFSDLMAVWRKAPGPAACHHSTLLVSQGAPSPLVLTTRHASLTCSRTVTQGSTPLTNNHKPAYGLIIHKLMHAVRFLKNYFSIANFSVCNTHLTLVQHLFWSLRHLKIHQKSSIWYSSYLSHSAF